MSPTEFIYRNLIQYGLCYQLPLILTSIANLYEDAGLGFVSEVLVIHNDTILVRLRNVHGYSLTSELLAVDVAMLLSLCHADSQYPKRSRLLETAIVLTKKQEQDMEERKSTDHLPYEDHNDKNEPLQRFILQPDENDIALENEEVPPDEDLSPHYTTLSKWRDLMIIAGIVGLVGSIVYSNLSN